ncbi:MAG TPA: hypothetical protein PLY45_02225 [bacterium]|nr:hypothetical protein [bacterium]
MKKSTQNTRNTTANTTTGKNSAGNYSGARVGVKGVKRNGQETIGVPRNYIVGTLCRDEGALSAFGEPLFGPVGTGTLSVAKGLLLYTILLEGEYSIVRYLPRGAAVGRGEILDIPMSFLPQSLSDGWKASVARGVREGGKVSVSEVRTLWRDFIVSTFPVDGSTYGPGFIGMTQKTGFDVSRGLMLYTIYREGEMAVHGSFTGPSCKAPVNGLSIKMNFLPAELSKRWQKTVAGLFTANPSTTEHDIMAAWRNFVAETVGTDAGRYVDLFSTMLGGGEGNVFNCLDDLYGSYAGKSRINP